MPPPELVRLVERFDRNLDDYRDGRYKEERVRVEFVNPFFELLGWDIDNKQGLAEAYKDVVHEDAIKVGGGTKAPDYCFRVGGTRKFFAETKKPSEDIKHNRDHAYQLRRYAWSAKLPISVLTDFEELAVYECKKRLSRGVPRFRWRAHQGHRHEAGRVSALVAARRGEVHCRHISATVADKIEVRQEVGA